MLKALRRLSTSLRRLRLVVLVKPGLCSRRGCVARLATFAHTESCDRGAPCLRAR
jgi:hypothetical protein